MLPHDQYQVRVEESRKLTLRNRRYLRKYTRFQPQRFEVVPVEKEIEKQAKVSEPVQVYRGQMVGEDRNEDLVPDRVVQGPVGGEGRVEDHVRDIAVRGPVSGDVPDAEVLQPEGAITGPTADPGPTVRRSSRVSRVPQKYKDYIMDE